MMILVMNQYKIIMVYDIGSRNYLDAAIVILMMIILKYEGAMAGSDWVLLGTGTAEDVTVDGVLSDAPSAKHGCEAWCDNNCTSVLACLDWLFGCVCSCCYVSDDN